MNRPRRNDRKHWPNNLIARTKGGAPYYSWRHPTTGKEYGLGRSFQDAASQAREQHVMCVVEQVALALDAYFSYERGLDLYIEELNGLYKESQDTTALESIISKAGEVMRERCIEVIDCEAIRALPGVTLKDIK